MSNKVIKKSLIGLLVFAFFGFNNAQFNAKTMNNRLSQPKIEGIKYVVFDYTSYEVDTSYLKSEKNDHFEKEYAWILNEVKNTEKVDIPAKYDIDLSAVTYNWLWKDKKGKNIVDGLDIHEMIEVLTVPVPSLHMIFVPRCSS